jgi:hypothetical protein
LSVLESVLERIADVEPGWSEATTARPVAAVSAALALETALPT